MTDQKGLSKKENISTATFKNKSIVQGTCLNLLILLPLNQMVTLLMTSAEAEPNPTYWYIAVFIRAVYCIVPEPSQCPPLNFSGFMSAPLDILWVHVGEEGKDYKCLRNSSVHILSVPASQVAWFLSACFSAALH